MQGPWSYDDSMGGNAITVADDVAPSCESFGGPEHPRPARPARAESAG
jgi:hypothetical protein